jgi:hypothetical protein
MVPRTAASVGYADSPFAVKVDGKLGESALRDVAVQSGPTPVTVAVCLTPGPADQPCGGGGPAAYPVKITVRLRVSVSLTV